MPKWGILSRAKGDQWSLQIGWALRFVHVWKEKH